MHGTVPIEIPYRLPDLLAGDPDWRSRFAWSVSPRTLFDAIRRLLSRYMDLVVAADSVERDVLLLGRLIIRTAPLIEAALAVQSESRAGLRYFGPNDLDVLRGETALSPTFATSAVRMSHGPERANWRWLRRVARTRSWTPWARLPRALLKPDAEIITHNELLRDFAKHQSAALRFDHARPLFFRCVAEGGSGHSLFARRDALDQLAERATDRLLDEPELGGDTRARLRPLLRHLAGQDLADADATLASLRRSRSAPRHLWSGTGSQYSTRALGLEALRRGGTARRFDHGGTCCLLDDANFPAQLELAVSTDFVTPTERTAKADVLVAAALRVADFRATAVLGHRGDPGLDPGPHARRGNAARSRRRVMFVGTSYYDFSQTYPPFPPAPLYLDWQFRVLEQLRGLPIELRHKPHPSGLFKGNPAPLAALAPIERRRFEETIGDADVFVFDIAASTTFSLALSTDRPVVLLDLGCMGFNATVRGMIERRCRIVPAGVDERNRFVVPPDALAAAVCGGPDRADPAEFRAYFLGE